MHRRKTGALICGILAAHWAAVLLLGQAPTRTPIRDTLENADGTPVNGELLIEWQSFTGPAGKAITRNRKKVDIVDGVVAVDLTPNENATPAGTSYRVRYTLDTGDRYSETWIVPESASAVTVGQVRVSVNPPVTPTVGQAQVEGLVGALAQKADVDQPNTFVATQHIREDAPGSPNPLLGLEKDDGSAGIYFKLPPLTSSLTLTLPNGPGLPNQVLTTDGSGSLFWSSGATGELGGLAYEVLQQAGSDLTQRTIANFAEGFALVDSPGTSATEIRPLFGTSAGTVTEGNDARLSDARQPLAHAGSHASGGSDPVTPLSIGALSRTNDFMLSTSQTTPVLKLQGTSGQSAALQEWRDGSGSLAALVGPSGDAFFREIGIAAKIGGTVASEFFQIDGLNRFALSSTRDQLRVLRYDDAGLFKDEAFRVNRSGPVESLTGLKISDSSVGSGATVVTGDYVEMEASPEPGIPASGTARIFLDSSSGELRVRKSSGASISLEQGGSGAPGGDDSFVQFNANGVLSGEQEFSYDAATHTLSVEKLDLGSGATPFNLTAYTDDAAPNAPTTANQFTAYVDRSSGYWSWIINGGLVQTAVTTDGAQTLTNKTFTSPTINNPTLFTNTYVDLAEMAAPSAPGSDVGRVYARDSGGTTKVCYKDSSGFERCIGDGGSSSCVVDSKLHTAVGQGNGADGGNLWGLGNAAHGESGNDTSDIQYVEINDTDEYYVPHVIEDCYTSGDLTIDVYLSVKGSSSNSGTVTWTEQCVSDNETVVAAPNTIATGVTLDFSTHAVNDLYILSRTYTPAACSPGDLAIVGFTYSDGAASAEPRVLGMRLHN